MSEVNRCGDILLCRAPDQCGGAGASEKTSENGDSPRSSFVSDHAKTGHGDGVFSQDKELLYTGLKICAKGMGAICLLTAMIVTAPIWVPLSLLMYGVSHLPLGKADNGAEDIPSNENIFPLCD